MLCLRQFNISYSLSILGSLLYAFLPYHFLRGISHLFLAAYYIVPLVIMVIIWIYEGRPLLFSQNQGKISLDVINPRSLASIFICILVSLVFFYYAFFSCFLLLVSGISLYLAKRNKLSLLISGCLIAIIVLGAFFNAAPTLLYQQEQGKNPTAAMRSPAEAEVYGLKITQLLLPVQGHRIPLFAKIRQIYASTTPLPAEGCNPLGIIGSIGFLILILWSLLRIASELGPRVSFREKELNCLSILNLSAVLLSTMGGFGSIIAYSLWPQIRCYNRISIFIGFFCIFAVLILLEYFRKVYVHGKYSRLMYLGLLGIFLVVGVLDQTTPSFIPPYDYIKGEFLNDAEFVNIIEKEMPEGSMIFQLPHVPFPENPPVNKMLDYSHLKGYLHSKNLRWSYGVMKGREGDIWQESVAAQPVKEMVGDLFANGFRGIYVDTYGYEDSGAQILQNLSGILKIEPLVSPNGRLYFFRLKSGNSI